ncbi:hypothetical protein [Vibrio jasicida]|uniref:hypothetical protein n=1 Tax=Vibrio jasicida TaxID=766224 RepID=UPI00148C1EC8|nr:hypothetical protein [Vibrio jasicida]NOJ19700.1 hypothetical protein [Vibrio jasicida]
MNIKLMISVLILAFTAGCVQMPTTESKTVDNRPQLTFSVQEDSSSDYNVVIDGLDNGSIAQYTTGKKALRVLPGTHIIEFYKDGALISSQKIYVGDGVTKEVIVE